MDPDRCQNAFPIHVGKEDISLYSGRKESFLEDGLSLLLRLNQDNLLNMCKIR